MERRLLSFLIGLVVLLSAVTAFVHATGEETAPGITVLSADTGNLTVSADMHIDLNGHSIAGVTVESGATLYISDSQTDDFSVSDGIFGTVTDCIGSVRAAEGYLPITEGEYMSFHRFELRITAMSLRPGDAGVYYSSSFSGDELVAADAKSFGIALSVTAEPTAENLETLCDYSVFSSFATGTNSATGTLLTGIMDEANTAWENAENAAMPVYGRPYILTSEGYLFGSCETRDLQTQTEAVDVLWDQLNGPQKDALLSMYETYGAVMEKWQLPNIQKAFASQEEMFVSKFRGDFLYRIGNGNPVTVGSLFATAEGVAVDAQTLEVAVTNLSGSAAGTYTPAAIWTDGKLSFSGLGVVEVMIRTENGTPTCLQLEVVEAVNSTTAASATGNNVVLLNDAGFGSITVSGGYTLYGNGFTLTCTTDAPALDMGYAFVTLNNGNLDNVRIHCPNFWHASLYKGNLTSEENETQVEGTRIRYYNARSAVMASGNNTISNSYISGGRAALYLTAGTTRLDNTTVYGGAAANIHVLPGASGLVLRDVKLIQEPIRATAKDKTLMGMSVVLMSGEDMAPLPPVTLEGELIQYAWIDESDAQYMPQDTSMIVEEVFAQQDFIHTVDGVRSVNLGFLVVPGDDKTTGPFTVEDNRTNKTAVPYGPTVLDIAFVGDVEVFSYSNENGTAEEFLARPVHTPDYAPAPLSMVYLDGNRSLTKEYNPVTNAWDYKLVVDLDAGECTLELGKLQVLRQGVPVDYTVTDGEGNALDADAQIPLSVGNVSYDITPMNEKPIRFTTVCTRAEILPPKLISADYESGLCVATSYGGTWSGAAPALEGIQIEYYSVAEGGYKTVQLSDCTPAAAGQQNGTNNTWFYTAENGDFTLTLTGGQVHSSNNIFAMPVVCDGKLYFVASSSKGLVNSGNTARTVTVTYAFRDNATDEELTFRHTWSVEENKDAQYKYSDFCSGKLTKLEGSSGGGCVTPDTLVTLADGSKKEIQHVTAADQLLVWDFYQGKYAQAPAAIVFNMGAANYNILNLQFADGTVVKTINGHRFFDANTNRYELINEANVEQFIGQEFVKAELDGYIAVKLESYTITQEHTTSYSIMSACHYNFIVEDFFSDTFHKEDAPLFEYFAIGDGMKYDEEKMQADMKQYGLYTYAEFADYLTYEQFEAFNVKYMKIAVGKGKATYEDILALIATYVN